VIEVSLLGPPIDARALPAPQQAAFIELLHQLDTEDWARPTVCPGWTVQDVAAHVLGDQVGRLSIHRDGFQRLHRRAGEASAEFLNRINHEWVTAACRISPALLTDLLAVVGDQLLDFWHRVDIDAIREATVHPGLTQPEYLGPVLDTFLRALPHTLRNAAATDGAALEFMVTGPAGGTWTCIRNHGRWKLDRRARPRPDARVELEADTTWRLCTRGLTPAQAASKAHTEGDERLAMAALQIVSIIC
jgi:hypothetical protein